MIYQFFSSVYNQAKQKHVYIKTYTQKFLIAKK